MPAPDPLEQLKKSTERSAKVKDVKKHAGDAKKILAQLAKAQSAGKNAKKELENETDAE